MTTNDSPRYQLDAWSVEPPVSLQHQMFRDCFQPELDKDLKLHPNMSFDTIRVTRLTSPLDRHFVLTKLPNVTKPLAFMSVHFDQQHKSFLITNVCTFHTHRRHGYASKLVKAVLRYYSNLTTSEFGLTASKSKPYLRAFYEHLGFHVRRRPSWVNGTPDDEYLVRKGPAKSENGLTIKVVDVDFDRAMKGHDDDTPLQSRTAKRRWWNMKSPS